MSYPYDTFGTVALTPYSMVRDWMTKFGHELDKEWNVKDGKLCHNLIDEEFGEVCEEIYVEESLHPSYFRFADLVDKEKLTKELCDLIWVCYFCAAKFGLPIDKAFERVYNSNMSKLGDDGKPVLREDGKILKGPNYQPVDLKDLF